MNTYQAAMSASRPRPTISTQGANGSGSIGSWISTAVMSAPLNTLLPPQQFDHAVHQLVLAAGGHPFHPLAAQQRIHILAALLGGPGGLGRQVLAGAQVLREIGRA